MTSLGLISSEGELPQMQQDRAVNVRQHSDVPASRTVAKLSCPSYPISHIAYTLLSIFGFREGSIKRHNHPNSLYCIYMECCSPYSAMHTISGKIQSLTAPLCLVVVAKLWFDNLCSGEGFSTLSTDATDCQAKSRLIFMSSNKSLASKWRGGFTLFLSEHTAHRLVQANESQERPWAWKCFPTTNLHDFSVLEQFEKSLPPPGIVFWPWPLISKRWQEREFPRGSTKYYIIIITAKKKKKEIGGWSFGSADITKNLPVYL